MANDIDMWNDIEELETYGDKEQANSLLGIYQAKFMEGNETEAEKLRKEFKAKYNTRLKYW